MVGDRIRRDEPSFDSHNDVASYCALLCFGVVHCVSEVPRTMGVRRVLLVDDDIHVREIAAFALEEIDSMEVVTCGGGGEAVEMVGRWRPDVIVLDLMMPGMDGCETLATLQKRLGSECPPVVFLTAKGRHENEEALKGLGAAGVLGKPFDPLTLGEDLRAAVEASCRR